jgi:hypothetical protein
MDLRAAQADTWAWEQTDCEGTKEMQAGSPAQCELPLRGAWEPGRYGWKRLEICHSSEMPCRQWVHDSDN